MTRRGREAMDDDAGYIRLDPLSLEGEVNDLLRKRCGWARGVIPDRRVDALAAEIVRKVLDWTAE